MQRITKIILNFSFCCAFISSGVSYSQEDSTTVKTEQNKGIPITGVVKNVTTGALLSGINIEVPNFSAVISNDDGTFTIHVPNLDTPLLLKGDGYQIKEFPLYGKSSVEILLYEAGYPSFYNNTQMPSGEKMESKVPYATGNIHDREAQWGASATEAVGGYIQGKVSGVYVTRRSGAPNVGADILIRGYNSLYATNKPLIIIDGMIYDDEDYGAGLNQNFVNSPISNIDIKDIEDISFIKDGSSLYGTKGGNGVMLITTTRAEELTTKIDFAMYGGFNLRPDKLPILGAGQYRTYLSELLTTKGLTQEGLQAQPFMNDAVGSPEYYQYHNNTNWQDRVFETISVNQNYYMKIQGGDNIAKYALSVGYLGNEGIIQNTGLTRYHSRFNADLQVSPKLNIHSNLSFVYGEQDLRNQGRSMTSPLNLSLIKAPFLSENQIDDNGQVSPNLSDSDIFNTSNPVAILNNAQGLNKNYRFFGNLNFGYEFNNSIHLNSIVGLNYSKVRENFFIPDIGVVNDTLRTGVVRNKSGSEVQRLFTLYNDTYLDYQKVSGYHSFDSRLGFRLQANKAESDYGYGFNSATDDFTSVGAGTNSLRQVGGFLGDWNWLNVYLATNYGYKNKYFLSLNLALDGSSRFGSEAQDWALGIGNEKFAFMPSLAGAWLISSESFMEGSAINFLKLRASYGLSGNDDIGNYTSKTYYVSQNLLGLQGLVRGNIGNPELQWEIVKKANLGLDISFLKERLSASVDVFSNNTDNMIIYEPVNESTGMEYVISNSGEMRTNGIDVSMNARVIGGDFKWDIGMTASKYDNEVQSLPVERIVTNFGEATFITTEGRPANLYYGLESNGVYTTNADAMADGLNKRLPNGELAAFRGGDIKFTDFNNDGIIDENDRNIIGDPNPDWVGMFNNKMSYKNITLNAIFTFSAGNDVYNGTRALLEGMSGFENQTQAVLNRWRTDGQQTDIPRVSWGDPMGNSSFSSRWIEDGSYVRLKTLILSYDIPMNDNTFKYAKVYVTGNNIFTATDYLGYDPEFSGSSSIYSKGVDLGLEPQFTTYQLGLRLGL
ncbi:SusC/RagA family TonB-linked outer membrane protein [Gramella sp. AN32]|uniref:SusC/RagA family TonB-linked outer membrane protein n=1 Tax=Christiangramia antarctica TaxID=2058158 RepID=A0ABW5X2L7_9FLAO|nr:SusC/RagA family TonB-linked outer membrane protein [Gramella sp. AN32]MCM4157234.1 SusC/RagA family TonB-linked outer membrane protein [Gramella sp. AN32]